MEASYFYLSLIIGLFISLLIEEIWGISAGGMIVPGYLSMVCDDLSQVILIFAISFIVFYIVNYILPRFIILFGRKKFVASLLVGVTIKLILELLFPLLPFSILQFRGIGVITPSLIANSYAKQGMRFTIPAVLVASYLTFFVVQYLGWKF